MSTLLHFLQKLVLHPFFLPYLLFVIFFYKCLSWTLTTKKNLPPSPPKLPIIGNFHQLGVLVHHSLRTLSQQYGKIMLLHLGRKPTLVVSSADAVREIMKTHDVVFSDRPESSVARRIYYDAKDVAFTHYDERWRKRRSICVMHLLSNRKVQCFRAIREEETALVIEKINRFGSSVVNLREIIEQYSIDMMCRVALGSKYGNNCEEGVKFRENLYEVEVLMGVLCWRDFVPWLSWIDRVNGLDNRVKKVAKELDNFVKEVVREHQYRLSTQVNDSEEGKNNAKNFVEILLEYQKENKDALQLDDVKGLILDMFTGGTGTSFVLIEWTMSELIRHPRVMKELQEELRKVVGGKSCRVSEDDLEKLRYLKAVIKEVLRLHPPGPLLLFRQSLRDVKIHDYDIAAGTQVIINAWAIQRDPILWEEPEEFRPERFLDGTTSFDLKRQDFQYIPFGGGRRICPGTSFAMANVELVVANLVYKFDWKLPDGKLDMTESPGINVAKRVPLTVIATPYHTCK